jgi:hypothetical protein
MIWWLFGLLKWILILVLSNQVKFWNPWYRGCLMMHLNWQLIRFGISILLIVRFSEKVKMNWNFLCKGIEMKKSCGNYYFKWIVWPTNLLWKKINDNIIDTLIYIIINSKDFLPDVVWKWHNKLFFLCILKPTIQAFIVNDRIR